MNLDPYIENLRHQLALAAETGGDDARALAERLVAQLEAAVRLTVQDALAAAAQEITLELAPGSVELRLRGREPEFVVTLPPAEASEADVSPESDWRVAMRPGTTEDDETVVSRINLRLPDHLKARVEQAAADEGLSVNTWLVRAAATTLQRLDQGERQPRGPRGGQHYTGWAR